MEIEVSETSVRAFLPAGVRAAPPPHAGRGFAVAASARLLLAVPGLRRRGAAPGPGQARRGARVSREAVGLDVDAPRSWRPCGRPPTRAVARDRLPLGVPRRVDDAGSSTGAGDHHRRPLVPRRVLPPGGRHAALPGRPDRRRAARSSDAGPDRPRPGAAAEEMFVPGPGRRRGPAPPGTGGPVGARVGAGAGRASRRRTGR